MDGQELGLEIRFQGDLRPPADQACLWVFNSQQVQGGRWLGGCIRRGSDREQQEQGISNDRGLVANHPAMAKRERAGWVG